jgi:putative transposase
LNEGVVNDELNELVRQSVEDTPNALLDEEADRLTNARRYEHTAAQKDTRSGHSRRKLLTRAGDVELKMPKLRNLTFETAIIQRYQKREISVEEALVEMYLAGRS